MAQPLMTPGVYIEEKNAFPGSVVEVATAIPAFIGYTEKASRNGKSLINVPTRITSFAEYVELFGGGFSPKFIVEKENKSSGEGENAPTSGESETTPSNVDEVSNPLTTDENSSNVTANGDTTPSEPIENTTSTDVEDSGTPPKHTEVSSFDINNIKFKISIIDAHKLLFYKSIRLFYANGGGTCYIVSVGTYDSEKGIEVKKEQLLGVVVEGGLKKLEKEQEPTLVVIPEAVLLEESEFYDVYQEVLKHCGKMQNRFGIFDLHGGNKENEDDGVVEKFREDIGSDFLSYGAVYYPWLHTSIVGKDEVTFKNLYSANILSDILPKSEEKAHTLLEKNPVPPKDKNKQIVLFKSKKKNWTAGEEVKDSDLKGFIENTENNLHLGLIATSQSYSELMDELRNIMNQMPAAPAMAGKYTAVDNSRGVWKAPANVSLNSVLKPMVNITHDQQKNLNVDEVSGKSINAIRTFPGVGTLVWGARTLNGNSLDWQYINVRRTIIMLEQSIKLALRAYVFEPNDANTWITVKSMIVNFLTEKWKQGALAGSSPEDAFDVQIGLGATMTGLDILQGKMLVSVKLAIVRPAEFIVVTFQQQMQKS